MEGTIVKEVRKARADHAKKFNCDLEAIVADIQEQQRASGRVFISLPAKRIEPVALKPVLSSSNNTRPSVAGDANYTNKFTSST